MLQAFWWQELVDHSLIRKFRRTMIVATAAIFALGLSLSLLLRDGSSLWVTARWTAICSPIAVGVAACLLQPAERMATALGLTRGGALSQLRPVILFWALAGIALPWIAAWLLADVSGAAFVSWRQQAGTGADSSIVWIVRLGIGAITYSLVSAAGVVLSYHLSSETDPRRD
jgi:hypothetical protein